MSIMISIKTWIWLMSVCLLAVNDLLQGGQRAAGGGGGGGGARGIDR